MYAVTALMLVAMAAVSPAQRGPLPPQSPPPTRSEPPQSEPPLREPPLPERGGAGRRDAPPALDAETEAWARSLVLRMGDPNRAIARSAAAGLIALGPPVVPMLRRSAESDVSQVARLANHALEEIRLGPPDLRRPGPRDGAGAPGRGPRGDRPGDEGPRRDPPRDGGPRGEGPRGEGAHGDGPRTGPDSRPPFPPPPREGARRDIAPRGERRDAAPREAPLPAPERARRAPNAPRPPRHDDGEAI